MSATNGLKHKVKEIIQSMDAIRADKENARDINLRAYLAENFEINGGPATPEHLYAELDIEPQRTRVKDLYADENAKYLMPEVVRDGVRVGMGIAQREQLQRMRDAAVASFGPVVADRGSQRFMSPEVYLDPQSQGLVQATFYPDLIVREEPVSQPTVTIPKIDLSKAELKDTNEAATIEEGTITYGSKDVKLTKKARGIKVTYESIEFNSLSLAQIWFRDAGIILGNSLNGLAVDTIVNGDQTGGSEAAAVIGVTDTAKGIQWLDIARVAVRGGLIGRVFSQAVGNETTTLNYIDLDEMKKMFFGSALLGTVVKTPITMPDSLYASAKIPTNQLALQDPAISLVQLTAIPLMVETEKIISKQIQASYTSIMTGFAKLLRNASVIIDGSITYAANPFPSWMAPYTTES